MVDERTAVVATATAPEYPVDPPFHPGKAWPDRPFDPVAATPNHAYDAVRAAFELAGLDEGARGTAAWNPLGELVAPGETVLLKPNLVKETHPRDPDGWRYTLTSGSVVRAVADYVYKALAGRGRVVLADSPQTDSSFSAMVRLLGLDAIARFYRDMGVRFDLVDLRQEEWTNEGGVIVGRRPLPGDPAGAVAFDLGELSELCRHPGTGRYYGADYDARVVNHHHAGGRHEYLLSGSAIGADVVFSLPKLKTHKKAGITVSLKNLVGVNTDKNYLPHHTEGSPAAGGDEHPAPGGAHRLERVVARGFREAARRSPRGSAWAHRHARRIGLRVFGDNDRAIRSGNWHGNDTIWRMCLDLNTLVLYGEAGGGLRPAGPGGRKRHLVLVDGIVAGEGRGPVDPDPRPAGIVVFARNPATADAACARLMGFDVERIPIVRNAFAPRAYPIADWRWTDVMVRSDREAWNGPLDAIAEASTLRFEPHFGWKHHIELTPPAGAAVGGALDGHI
ncbi:MAG: DUF362 domain-containing protein [Acidimicrobiales bacterium]